MQLALDVAEVKRMLLQNQPCGSPVKTALFTARPASHSASYCTSNITAGSTALSTVSTTTLMPAESALSASLSQTLTQVSLTGIQHHNITAVVKQLIVNGVTLNSDLKLLLSDTDERAMVNYFRKYFLAEGKPEHTLYESVPRRPAYHDIKYREYMSLVDTVSGQIAESVRQQAVTLKTIVNEEKLAAQAKQGVQSKQKPRGLKGEIKQTLANYVKLFRDRYPLVKEQTQDVRQRQLSFTQKQITKV